MLGRSVSDPEQVEAAGIMDIAGMGLLDMDTVFRGEKVQTQTRGTFSGVAGELACLNGLSYEGYEIQMHGTVYRDDTLTVGQFGLIRMLMSCCVADLQPCGPLCIWDQAETLSQDEWVTVTGTYHYDEEKGMEIQVLKVEKAEAAEDEYVYPVY